jgi:hypothetical protein
MRNLNAKIEQNLVENKTSVKTYSSMEGAIQSAVREEQRFQKIVDVRFDLEVLFITLHNGRISPVFNMTKWLAHPKSGGFFIGYFAQRGFMSI